MNVVLVKFRPTSLVLRNIEVVLSISEGLKVKEAAQLHDITTSRASQIAAKLYRIFVRQNPEFKVYTGLRTNVAIYRDLNFNQWLQDYRDLHLKEGLNK